MASEAMDYRFLGQEEGKVRGEGERKGEREEEGEGEERLRGQRPNLGGGWGDGGGDINIWPLLYFMHKYLHVKPGIIPHNILYSNLKF